MALSAAGEVDAEGDADGGSTLGDCWGPYIDTLKMGIDPRVELQLLPASQVKIFSEMKMPFR